MGIDLAAQAKDTAACVLRWPSIREGSISVLELTASQSDEDLLTLIREHRPEKVAIDAPFGWPDDFVAAVCTWHRLKPWPTGEVPRRRLRDTDRLVLAETGQRPLSVSSDKIAATAMRCAGFLTKIRALDEDVARDGSGLVAEVYPAAALRNWSLPYDGYKGPKADNRAARQSLVTRIGEAWGSWLQFGQRVAALEQSDHLLDALICAVVARAVAAGMTRTPDAEQRLVALREGWIHVPRIEAASVLDLRNPKQG